MDKHSLPLQASQAIRIGIDATNIRIGGGVTHLLELLSAIEPEQMQVKEVVIWGNSQALQSLPNASWIVKINPPSLNMGLMRRVLWQIFSLSSAVKKMHCDVLFVPGGSYVGSFHPAVTMSQNLLPFEWEMINKSGFSLRILKFILLRWAQSFSFKRSDGVIFLTEYAKRAVRKVTGSLAGKSIVIPHGLNPRFDYQPKSQLPIEQYSQDHLYRLLYVSTVDVYKNQLELIEAVQLLRHKGYPLALTLIGPNEPQALTALQSKQKQVDPESQWLEYLGALPYKSLNLEYQKADLGVFASRCETFGMTVLEKMSVGLPIACSRESSMHEILSDAGIYFDPTSPSSIAEAIEQYLLSPNLRDQNQQQAHVLAQQYTWEHCALETVAFLHEIAAAKTQSKPSQA
jgi:glycosyltransferase involved in cell wall biosynthesis